MIKKATDLEVYEVITSAYPEKFPETGECNWDEVMEFVEDELGGYDIFADLLGRLVTLTDPGRDPNGELWHRFSTPISVDSSTRISLMSRQGDKNV